MGGYREDDALTASLREVARDPETGSRGAHRLCRNCRHFKAETRSDGLCLWIAETMPPPVVAALGLDRPARTGPDDGSDCPAFDFPDEEWRG